MLLNKYLYYVNPMFSSGTDQACRSEEMLVALFGSFSVAHNVAVSITLFQFLFFGSFGNFAADISML